MQRANQRLNIVRQHFQHNSIVPPYHASTEDQDELLSSERDGVGRLTLNRPKKLNALSTRMLQAMLLKLQEWEDSDQVKLVLVQSAESGRAFCAGADVKRAMDDVIQDHLERALQLFRAGYDTVYYTSALQIPYISIIDGVTMGGGVGISVHAPFRVATENTILAMPDTKIGFFPDIGVGFFLSRMDGQLGLYLGLTGQHLRAADVLYSGAATHYVPSARLAELERRLASLQSPVTHDQVNRTIESCTADLEHIPSFSLGYEIRDAIDRMKEIVAALQQETSKKTVTWAQETLGCLNAMCPTSLTVALQHIRSATTLSLVQCLRRDFVLTQKFIIRPDMRQGVYQTPAQESPTQWSPATLDQVDEALTELEFFCTPSPHSLTMATPIDFVQYPYRHYMLPSEAEIKQMVVEASAAAAAAGRAAITMTMTQVGCYGMTTDQAVIYFSRQRNGKQGVRQKVTEVLARKTRTVPGPDGLASLEWIE